MKKQIIIRGKADIDRYMEEILASAEETQINVCELSGNKEAMDLLYRMKFEEIGCDPLNSQRSLNLIEQLNKGGRWCRKCLTIKVRYEILEKCRD